MVQQELRISTVYLPSGKKFCIGVEIAGYSSVDVKFINDLFSLFAKDGIEPSIDDKAQANAIINRPTGL